jgi:hypothetical protein
VSFPHSVGRWFWKAALLVAGLSSGTGYGFTVDGISSEQGLIGETVTLTGTGFASGQSYRVVLGEVSIPATRLSEGELTFVLPADARPNTVQVQEGETPPTPTLFWMEVLREIDVTMAGNLGINTAAYTIGSIFGDSTDAGPVRKVRVSNGEATLVAASSGPDQPSFLGMVTDEDSFQIDARTTAVAMVFMVPGLVSLNVDVAGPRLETMANLPEAAEAAEAIRDATRNRGSFLEDSTTTVALRKLLIAAVEELLAPLNESPARRPKAWRQVEDNPTGVGEDFVSEFLNVTIGPRQLSDAGYEDIEFIETSLGGQTRNEAGIPHQIIKVEAQDLNDFIKGHPLDQLVEVYRLSTQNFDNLAEIKSLQGSLSRVYLRQNTVPVDQRVIPGGISLQIGGVDFSYSGLKGYLGVDALTSTVTFQFDRPGELLVPVDHPGIYLVRAYSGAVFFPQWDMINALPDRGAADDVMFVENIGVGLIEATIVFLKIRGGGGGGGRKVLSSGDATGIIAAASKELLRKTAEEGLTFDGALSVLQKAAAKLVETVLENSFSIGVEEESSAVADAIDTISKWWDLATKEIPQAFARFIYIYNASNSFFGSPSIKGVETSIFVVGDPYKPRIRTLSTQQGPRGSEVVITGSNFSANKDDIIIRFGELPSSPEDPNAGGPIAEIISSGNSWIGFKVPELPNPGGPPIVTPIHVTVIGKGSDSSANLREGKGIFTVMPDPVITAITPDPPMVNGVMRIEGTNFNGEFSRNKVMTDFNELQVLSGSETHLMVRVPNSTFPENVRVIAHGRESNAVEVTPVLPELADGGGADGWFISVSSNSLGNASDGDITLEEALLLASGGTGGGGLGRDLNRRPENNNDPQGSFESDWVVEVSEGAQAGIASADYIEFALGPGDRTIPVNKDLPPLARYDILQSGNSEANRIHLDGSGAPGDGLVAMDASQAKIIDVRLTGFPGAAIRVKGTTDNFVVGRVIAQGTGQGLVVDGTATELFFQNLQFTNILGHGLHLGEEDGSVISNSQIEFVDIEGCLGHGIILENNVSQIRFNEIDIRLPKGNGITFSGPGVRENSIGRSGILLNSLQRLHPDDEYGIRGSDGYGLVLENGASDNVIDIGHFLGNKLGGILVTGTTTVDNAIGTDSGFNGSTGFFDIADSEGPGITIRAPRTRVSGFCIYDNGLPDTDGNHGILIDSPDAVKISIHSVRIGYNDAIKEAAPAPNMGSGIAITNGANDILIGTYTDLPQAKNRSFIAGNRDHGILISGNGTQDITINHTDIGRADTDASPLFNFYARADGYTPMGNELHGIAITNGAREIYIGSFEIPRDVHIVDHTEGAGVYVEGPESGDVRIWGSRFGTGYFGEKEPNRVGIHLTGGTQNNVIGMRGEPYRGDNPSISLNKNFHNTFAGSTVAGIWIEDSGGGFSGTIPSNEPPPTPSGGNVIINNAFTRTYQETGFPIDPNEVGILLTGESYANRIGGEDPSDENEIRGSNRAGIELRGVSPPHPGLSNRIIGNQIIGGGGMLVIGEDPLPAPGQTSAGILLSEGSSGNIVGGLAPGERNLVNSNYVGVWIDGDGTDNTTSGNHIRQMLLANNKNSGVFVRDGHGNVIGPELEVNRNGNFSTGLGGIVLLGGKENRIIGNWIGNDKRESIAFDIGNRHSGIVIIDSKDNLVGGIGPDSNRIVGNQENGVVVEGANSTGNRFFNNTIGVFNNINRRPQGNPGAGILFRDGAHNNSVGGILQGINRQGIPYNVELPNIISRNGVGIATDGADTIGNRFTRNIITRNDGFGIANFTGGNQNLPPPVISSASTDIVIGSVDTTQVPDGSIVEIFSDGDDEGDQYIGSGLVSEGKFAIKPIGIFGPRINATVTHAQTESTSAFGTGGSDLVTVRVARRDDIPPTNRDIPNSGLSLLAVVEFTSIGLPAIIDRVTFSSSGSANESTAIGTLRAYHDMDDDGTLSMADVILQEGLAITEDNGDLVVEPTLHVPADSKVSLLLAGDLNGTATETETLIFTIEDALKVSTVGSPVPFSIPEIGTFPVVSDTNILFQGTATRSGFDGFIAASFPGETDPEIIGADKDPDKDGRDNLREYAEGTNPGLADAPGSFEVRQTLDELTVSFTERSGVSDLSRELQSGTSPGDWTSAQERVLSTSVEPIDGTRNRVTMRVTVEDLSVRDIYLRVNWQRLP